MSEQRWHLRLSRTVIQETTLICGGDSFDEALARAKAYDGGGLAWHTSTVLSKSTLACEPLLWADGAWVSSPAGTR